MFWDLLNYCESKFGIFFESDGYEIIWEDRYMEYYEAKGYPAGKAFGDPYYNDYAQFKFQIEYQNSVYSDMNAMLRPYLEKNQ